MLTPHLYVANYVGVLDRSGGVVVPRAPVPVVVDVRWQDGSTSEHPGVATAWNTTEVDVRFHRRDAGAYQVWVPVADVRRR